MKKTLLLLILIVICINTYSQSRLLSGSVHDMNGNPVPGVNVGEKGASALAVTDEQGNFQIQVESPSRKILVFTLVGYLPHEEPVGVNTRFSITLLEDVRMLDDLMVVGYGSLPKKLVTGATAQVDGKEIQRLNTVSVLDALKSNTTGLQIVKSSGQPGSEFRINIRGLGTAGNATPLFVVDGVTVSNIEFLNPADIASVDILKDAASASIYGSRAANGVILITTKKGTYNAKPSISYDVHVGWQNVYKKLPLLNAQEYAQMMNEARANDGLAPFDFNNLVPNWGEIESGQSNGTDWLEAAQEKNAPIQNHAVSIRGGSISSTYAVGFTYTNQQGILGKPVSPYYQRYTGRINLEQILMRIENREFLKSGQSVIYGHTSGSRIADYGVYSNSLRYLIATNPFLPLYDKNGEYHYSIPWRSAEANPVAYMDYIYGHNKNRNNELLANGFLELIPIEGLKIKSSFGYTLNSGSYRSFRPPYDLSTIHRNPENEVTQSMWNGMSLMNENTLNYLKKWQHHSFDVLLGNTIQRNDIGENLQGSNVNSIFDDFQHAYLMNAPAVIPGKTQLSGFPWGENKLLSYFGRLNYNFAEKYLLTLVMRADGSSKFARGKRWGYFPSVAGGWMVSSEPFMKNTSAWLDLLKLRLSWGQNGNQNIPSFQYLSTISFVGADYWGVDKSKPFTGAYPDIMPNPDITWETSEQINFGIDMRALQNRLDVTLDLYTKTTKDWLVRAPVLASYGTAAPYINGGNVNNKGVELGIQWRDNLGKLNYFVGGNISHNHNKVTRIANTEKIIHGPTETLGTSMSEIFRAQEGFPIGFFWGYKTDGIFQNEAEVLAHKNSQGVIVQPDAMPGDVRFVNMNDDNIIDDNDKVMIGDPNPDLTFGINLGADYNGFYFTLSGNGVAGNQIARNYRSPDIQQNNYTTEIFGRWHGEGTSDRIPKVSMSTHINRQYMSDLYIENGDYFRISNITLGYDIKQIISKMIPIQQMKIYASLLNAFTFTKYEGMV